MNKITDPDELWAFQKVKLKELYPYLEEADFHYDYGEKDRMVELLRKKLDKSREQLAFLLSTL